MKPSRIKAKIIAVIIAIMTLAIVFLSLFFFTDIFRTKKGAFFRYFKVATKSLEILDTKEYNSYNNLKKTIPYIRKSEIYVKSSSNVADTSIMDKLRISMNSKSDYKNGKYNSEITINSQNDNLAAISLIRDKQTYSFYSPLISNGYIGVRNENLKELAEAIGIDGYVPNEISEIRIDKLLEKTKVEQSHLETYYNLLKNETPDTAYSKKTNVKVKLDEDNYNTTEYTLKLSSKESAELQINLLSKLSQDSIMMNFITSKARLLNLDTYISDINSLNSKMQERIESFKLNPDEAEEIDITINEYRQKNLKTTIKINDTVVSFAYLKEGDTETGIYSINDKSIKVIRTNDEYTIKYSYVKDDIDKSFEIKHRMEGTIEDNNIKNIAEITTKTGIKSVTYSYTDQINFTNDIGTITDLSDKIKAILNDYPKEEVSQFAVNLKKKINEVYINKGASIGINLDPIL